MLHDQVRLARLELADVEDASDVLTLERRRDSGFVQEALHRLQVAFEIRSNELDGDRSAQPYMSRQANDTHATFADDASDSVPVRDGLSHHHR